MNGNEAKSTPQKKHSTAEQLSTARLSDQALFHGKAILLIWLKTSVELLDCE